MQYNLEYSKWNVNAFNFTIDKISIIKYIYEVI